MLHWAGRLEQAALRLSNRETEVTSREWWLWDEPWEALWSALCGMSPQVHNVLGEMERCEKRDFQLLKMQKKNQLKHKNQVRNRLFIDS